MSEDGAKRAELDNLIAEYDALEGWECLDYVYALQDKIAKLERELGR